MKQVPIEPASNADHPNYVEGIHTIKVLTSSEEQYEKYLETLTATIGHEPRSSTSISQANWTLDSPNNTNNEVAQSHPILCLCLSTTKRPGEAQAHHDQAKLKEGIVEISFYVSQKKRELDVDVEKRAAAALGISFEEY